MKRAIIDMDMDIPETDFHLEMDLVFIIHSWNEPITIEVPEEAMK